MENLIAYFFENSKQLLVVKIIFIKKALKKPAL